MMNALLWLWENWSTVAAALGAGGNLVLFVLHLLHKQQTADLVKQFDDLVARVQITPADQPPAQDQLRALNPKT